MPPEIKARELLTLLLDDEEYNSNRGPRSIVGFEELLEKMDKLCDAITQREGGGGTVLEGGGADPELLAALVENMVGLRAVLEREPPAAPQQSEEMQTLLTQIAKNTMRRQRAWEFDVQRDRRTGFTEKIIARPVGE